MTSASFAASPAKEARLAGVPNPIVTYDTYQAAAKTAGFAPLYLTKDAGYSCNYISLISKDTADLGFQKLGQTSTTVRVRTMPQKAAKGTNDISGVYSVTWKDQVIDGTTVSVAKTNHKKEAARPLFYLLLAADGTMPMAQRMVKTMKASWIWSASQSALPAVPLWERMRVMMATLRTWPMRRTVLTTEDAAP